MANLLLPVMVLALAAAGAQACNPKPGDCGGPGPGKPPEEKDPKHKYPWQVSMQMKNNTKQGEHYCSAAVLNDLWVLTTKWCFDLDWFDDNNVDPAKDVTLIAGDYDLIEEEGSEQERNVEAYVYISHHIAVLKVSKPLAIDKKTVMPICLTDPEKPTRVENCVVSGWGDTNSTPSHLMKELNMPILKKSACKKFGTKSFGDSICAGYYYGDEGEPCWGDHGTSLACLGKDGYYYVRGVLTHLTSTGCMPPYTPAVFEKVEGCMNCIFGLMATKGNVEELKKHDLKLSDDCSCDLQYLHHSDEDEDKDSE